MSEEFISKKGYVTCEFSIQEKYLVAAHNYTFEKNRARPAYGEWRIFKCATCIEHSERHPYHVEIAVVDERPEMPAELI